ncbi:MAG TPA: phosphoenolpyruvate carboxykinase (ATP) [Candidatus Nanoarchaeia archaeon]|nr:phosphoenolpyruvate carboxykinase (ATP) [Candidatus Nanoarchaeia archaeon]
MMLMQRVRIDLRPKELLRMSVERGEGVLSNKGCITVTTGKYTGRSPNDRFFVKTRANEKLIDWGDTNMPLSENHFDRLYKKITKYLAAREHFVLHATAGADERYSFPITVTTEYAYQNLFMHHLLRHEKLKGDPITVICAPGCVSNPATDGTHSEAFIVIHTEKRIILIGGTKYCGEIKKAVFTLCNYLYPLKGLLSMHCSANIGKSAALFFGLSGTGKTTLSMDPKRKILGDDETVWTPHGIFNIEGGSYAKCIYLKRKHEPLIYDAIRDSAVVENVVMKKGKYNYDDDSITENTRAGFPLSHVKSALRSGKAVQPKTVIFLTADAFGVLPPIAKLTLDQAIYHFLSGYTSKLAETERGITTPRAAFSLAFGQPFMPLKAQVYARLLRKNLLRSKAQVFLINTGWYGGPYGVGKRFPIPITRKIVTAAIEGRFDTAKMKKDELFQFEMPLSCPGVPARMMRPEWANGREYLKKKKMLAQLFEENKKGLFS